MSLLFTSPPLLLPRLAPPRTFLRAMSTRPSASTSSSRIQAPRTSATATAAPTAAAARDALLQRKGYRRGDKVVVFDGVCAMCNAGVDVVLRLDTARQFKFAALQSPTGRALVDKFACPADLSTMVYVEGDAAYIYSDAMLRIARRIPWFYMPAQLAIVFVPKRLRDFVYTDVIAKYRYDVFGKRDECRLVEPGQEHRFLD